MFQKLRTVIYHVTDLEKAKEWYTSLTGEQPYFDEPFYVGFDINGCELGLDPDMEHIQEGNQTIAYWSVNNIEEAFTHALELEAKIIQPVTNVGGTVETAIVEDPFGNHIGLIAGA
jgi:predicted enzyme related to lactoylglutathione lyase